ncbi:helix-turn-helix domain-containing protein [Desulfosarcina widdelii]|uniref:Helix-turn-helix domain-containing protein n=1 Tax=Desulfosarcina widdelii TaxID=947919 RepID=A0A5K7Z084_9BACT|nr:helix-turn-helix domain-containing protein [Desulfosarcina widdelii]BBO74298.1 helix-turn-helix domain-containing protein [Desulfosarcina widdelii]
MESENNLETFGSYLQSFRIKRELTIEEVAAKTRIAAHCLKAIEADDHEHLPPPAYVRSFIRTIADIVGANADLAVNLYRADLKQQETTRKLQLRRRAKLGAAKRTLLAAALIVGILLLLRYTDIGMSPTPSGESATTERSFSQPAPGEESEAAGRGLVAAKPREKLKLKVIAVEQTWLKVIVDGQNAKSYKLKAEERLELEGSSDFNLMIGNATAVKVFLDDRPVKIFGGSDQVVSLKIP